MTNDLLKEAIYAVALRDMLNKYPYGCFAQLYYNYIRSLEPQSERTYIFYHLCTEAARDKMERWPRIVGTTYPDLRETYYKIVEKIYYVIDPEENHHVGETPEECVKIYKNLKITHCVNGKYFCPIHQLDYTAEEFSDILRKMPEYSQVDFKKELEQIKLDRIKEDF